MRQPPPRGTHAEWQDSQSPGVGRHSAAEPGSVKSERHLTVERRTALRGGNYSAEPPRALGGAGNTPRSPEALADPTMRFRIGHGG
jgi:hypothetical protein